MDLNLEGWSSEKVCEWLSGVDVSTALIDCLKRQNVDGANILLYSIQELLNFVNFRDLDEEYVFLNAIHSLLCVQKDHNYSTLQLKLVQLNQQLSRLSSTSLSSNTIRLYVLDWQNLHFWLSRPHYQQLSIQLLPLKDALWKWLHFIMDKYIDTGTSLNDELLTKCQSIMAMTKEIVEDCNDPVLASPVQLLSYEQTSTKKKHTYSFDRMELRDNFNHIVIDKNQSQSTTNSTPSTLVNNFNNRIAAGDELIAINSTIVVNWRIDKVRDLLKECLTIIHSDDSSTGLTHSIVLTFMVWPSAQQVKGYRSYFDSLNAHRPISFKHVSHGRAVGQSFRLQKLHRKTSALRRAPRHNATPFISIAGTDNNTSEQAQPPLRTSAVASKSNDELSDVLSSDKNHMLAVEETLRPESDSEAWMRDNSPANDADKASDGGMNEKVKPARSDSTGNIGEGPSLYTSPSSSSLVSTSTDDEATNDVPNGEDG